MRIENRSECAAAAATTTKNDGKICWHCSLSSICISNLSISSSLSDGAGRLVRRKFQLGLVSCSGGPRSGMYDVQCASSVSNCCERNEKQNEK